MANPKLKAAQAEADRAEAFVAVDHVGPHFPGDVFTIGEDAIKRGVDAARLLALKAIRPAEGDEAKDAVPYGTDTNDYMPTPAANVPEPVGVTPPAPTTQATTEPAGQPAPESPVPPAQA